MNIKIIGMLGAAALLAACNQATDTERAQASPAGSTANEKPKLETYTNGIITKGLTEFEKDPAKSSIPDALAKSTSTPWIGLIPTGDPALISCPDGVSALRFDDEDDSNRNHFFVNGSDVSYHNYAFGGLIHSSSPWRAGGNTWIKYCNKQINSLPILSHDYAVISASNTCPANSTRFYHRWDDEDSGNHNTSEGDVTPGWSSTSGSATGMYFCFVPAGSGKPDWDWQFDGSFVFTRKAFANHAQSDQDDEDDHNNNQYASDNSSLTTRMQALISGGGNTTMYIASNSAATAIDMGTKTDCSDFKYHIGVKCDFGPDGTRNCRPIGGVEDYWAALQHVMCLF